MGMSPEFLERIFLPFERVHTSQVSRIEGTGLGMSIVKNLVDGMGGQITVESREGEGSCFRVELPLPVSAQRRPPLALPAGQTVLVAEILDDLAGQASDCLREEGLVPVRITSGLEAVTWLTEAQVEDRMPCALLLGGETDEETYGYYFSCGNDCHSWNHSKRIRNI